MMQNYTHSQVKEILQASVGFLKKWKYVFLENGIAGCKLKHKGSKSYLTPVQHQTVIERLKQKN